MKHYPKVAALILSLAAAPLIAAPSTARADEPGTVTTLRKAPVTGEEVYQQICQSCHMANGMGGKGAAIIPALAGNPRLANSDYIIITVAKGRGAMPWFDDILAPAQIAGVATYVRTHFGNNYAKPVTEAQVKALAGTKTSP
jgi:mono/diheme cytochrome c family protein